VAMTVRSISPLSVIAICNPCQTGGRMDCETSKPRSDSAKRMGWGLRL
jgi:hypothetical protein